MAAYYAGSLCHYVFSFYIMTYDWQGEFGCCYFDLDRSTENTEGDNDECVNTAYGHWPRRTANDGEDSTR